MLTLSIDVAAGPNPGAVDAGPLQPRTVDGSALEYRDELPNDAVEYDKDHHDIDRFPEFFR